MASLTFCAHIWRHIERIATTLDVIDICGAAVVSVEFCIVGTLSFHEARGITRLGFEAGLSHSISADVRLRTVVGALSTQLVCRR